MPGLNIHPAYGRRYETLIEARQDWEQGQDFKIIGGPYLSIRDTDKLKADGFDQVKIFYTGDFSRYCVQFLV